MRLLSELFPNFVKKSQIERLDKGPFGAGVMKARTYLKPGEEPPQGVKVQSGPQGGRYYEEEGTANWGRGSTYGDAQGRYDDMDEARAVKEGYDSVNQTLNEIDAAKPSMNLKNEFYRTLDAKQQEVGRQVTPDEYKEVLDDTVSTLEAKGKEGGNVGSKVDLEPQKRLNSNLAAKEAELGRTLTNDEKREVFNQTNAAAAQGLEPGRKPDVGIGSKVDLGPQKRLNNNIATKEGQLGRKLTNDEKRKVFEATMAAAAQGVEADEDALPMSILRPSPEGLFEGDVSEPAFDGDVSEPAFDGQGNVQLPGGDPFPVGELTGNMVQESGLKEQYEAETGFSIGDDTSAFFNDYGNVGLDSFDSTLMNQWGLDEDSQFDASSFLDWVNSKSGATNGGVPSGPSEDEDAKRLAEINEANRRSGLPPLTMQMAKMNVIKKRDPIVLANKGGNQRRNAYVRGIYKK